MTTTSMQSDSDLSDTDSDCVVELGLPDRTVHEYDRLDPFVSRLGGEPTWLCSAPKEDLLTCQVCSSKMFLLVQFDCPEGDTDRVLYVFACNTKKCVMHSPNQAFQAILQSRPAAPKVDNKASAVKATNFWETANDEPSIESKDKQPTDIVNCAVKATSKHAFPVTVLKIVEELIRHKKDKQVSLNDTINTDGNDDDDWSGEEEETTVKEDTVMDEFMSRISHYPRQCLRYSPHGRPLHFSQRHADSLTRVCTHCHSHSTLVFLAQLMPAFLSIVPVDAHTDHIPASERNRFAPFGDGLEFATVLVYLCERCDKTMVRVEMEEYHDI